MAEKVGGYISPNQKQSLSETFGGVVALRDSARKLTDFQTEYKIPEEVKEREKTAVVCAHPPEEVPAKDGWASDRRGWRRHRRLHAPPLCIEYNAQLAFP